MAAKRPESLVYTIYIVCLVCLYPINVKMAEPIGSKFCVPRINICYLYCVCLSLCLFVSNQSVPNLVWDLTWPQGRVMDDQNFKS